MPRNITFTQEQKELVALLPNGLPKMTDGAKLVLSNIIYWYGTEFAKENGYIFRSDSDMRKDTGVGENTVKRAIRELETKGFFDKVKRGVFGDRKNGTEFYLTEEMKEKIHFNPTESTQANNSISQANNSISQANNENEQLIEQMNTILMKLNELSEENKQLREKIDRLEENFIGLTDTDTDSNKNIKSNTRYQYTMHEVGIDDNLITLFYQKGRLWGERQVSGEEFFFNLNEEIEKHSGLSTEERDTLRSIATDAYTGSKNTQPKAIPYADAPFTSFVREAC